MESNREMLKDLSHIADVITGHGGRSSRTREDWRKKENQIRDALTLNLET